MAGNFGILSSFVTGHSTNLAGKDYCAGLKYAKYAKDVHALIVEYAKDGYVVSVEQLHN